MITKIKQLLNSLIPPDTSKLDDTLAIVSLLCEVCIADEKTEASEKAAVVHTLKKLIGIDDEKASELLTMGMEEVRKGRSLFDFTSQLRDLDNAMRIKLVKAMWAVAYADGYLDPMEEALIRKVAALIYVNHSDFIRAKLAVMPC